RTRDRTAYAGAAAVSCGGTTDGRNRNPHHRVLRSLRRAWRRSRQWPLDGACLLQSLRAVHLVRRNYHGARRMLELVRTPSPRPRVIHKTGNGRAMIRLAAVFLLLFV